MPTSWPYQINEIMELIIQADPSSILDIGVGFGKYGVLSREYLELWSNEDIEYGEWKRTIDGIEAFEKYLTPLHKYIYNRIYIGNALSVLPNINKKYDIILIIDVLEHFSHEDGIKLLSLALEKGKDIIISTPKDIGHQEASFGNPYERHRFQWTKSHFKKMGHAFFVPNDHSLICFVGKDALKVKQSVNKSIIKREFHFLRYPLNLLRNILKSFSTKLKD